jgi:hypothetical protein
MGSGCSTSSRTIHYVNGLVHQFNCFSEKLIFSNGDTFEGTFELNNEKNKVKFIDGELLLKNKSNLKENGITFLHDRNILCQDDCIDTFKGIWFTENFKVNKYEGCPFFEIQNGNLPNKNYHFYIKKGTVKLYNRTDNTVTENIININYEKYNYAERYKSYDALLENDKPEYCMMADFNHNFVTIGISHKNKQYYNFGDGIIKFEDGSEYTGEICDGLPCGKGIMTNPKEVPMKGTWAYGECVNFEFQFGDAKTVKV